MSRKLRITFNLDCAGDLTEREMDALAVEAGMAAASRMDGVIRAVNAQRRRITEMVMDVSSMRRDAEMSN